MAYTVMARLDGVLQLLEEYVRLTCGIVEGAFVRSDQRDGRRRLHRQGRRRRVLCADMRAGDVCRA